MDYSQITPIEILLVEDNPGDTRLIQEALKDSKIYNTLSTVIDGRAALEYLRKEGRYEKVSTPDLILLDLDLPHISGREVLETVKADKKLRQIPIVILTVSPSEQDVLNSYDMHVNAYIKKPLDLDQFVKVIGTIEDFWFTIVKLPGR
jgi:chemotaxis family two-component system response regulator Rcp1